MQYSLPEEFKDFLLFSCISQLESSENSGEIVQSPQFVMLSSGPLFGKESIWSDLTPICFEKHYKLGRLDQEEVSALHTLYSTLFPHITVVTLAAHFNVQTCLKHVKELFSRTGNKKRPNTTNSLKKKRQI